MKRGAVHLSASASITTLNNMSDDELAAAREREARTRRDGFGFARAVPRRERLYPRAGDMGLGEYGPVEAQGGRKRR